MSTALSIIGAILVLCVLVVVHELGHYGAARLVGIKVMEFGVGMGPKIYAKEKNGILYSLRLFPVGGFCRFYGEDEAVRDSDSFGAQKVWKRAIVIFSGAFCNIVFSILLAIAAIWAFGDYNTGLVAGGEDQPAVWEGYPAAAAGLQEGDIFVAIDGKKIDLTSNITDMILGADPSSMEVTVLRDGELYSLTIQNFYSEERGRNFIGVTTGSVRRYFDFREAVGYSFEYIWVIMRETFSFLGSLFVPGTDVLGNVTGPVGTISIIGQAVRAGFEPILRLAMFVGMSLGIVNLLPVPGLDGAKLVFLGIEKARGRAIPPEKEGLVHFIGLIALLLLMVLLTFNDISRLIGG